MKVSLGSGGIRKLHSRSHDLELLPMEVPETKRVMKYPEILGKLISTGLQKKFLVKNRWPPSGLALLSCPLWIFPYLALSSFAVQETSFVSFRLIRVWLRFLKSVLTVPGEVL